MPKLIVCQKTGDREYPLGDEPRTCGRGDAADIPIGDKHASREHCRFEREGGKWFVVDLGSGNGTLVGGERISRHELSDGTAILIGETSLVFVDDAAAVPASEGEGGPAPTTFGPKAKSDLEPDAPPIGADTTLLQDEAGPESWSETLSECEAERLHEWESLVAEAGAAQKLPELGSALAEIRKADWSNQDFSAPFVRAAEKLLPVFRYRVAEARYDELCEEMRVAYSSRYEGLCRTLIQEWAIIQEQTDALPNAQQTEQVASVEAWLAELQNSQEDDDVGQEAVISADPVIDDRDDLAEVSKPSATASQSDRGMPEMISARVTSPTRGSVGRVARSRLALIMICIVIGLALLAAGIAAAVCWNWSCRSRLADEIRVAMSEQDYELAEKKGDEYRSYASSPFAIRRDLAHSVASQMEQASSLVTTLRALADEANGAYEEKRYYEARDKYKQIIGISPGFGNALAIGPVDEIDAKEEQVYRWLKEANHLFEEGKRAEAGLQIYRIDSEWPDFHSDKDWVEKVREKLERYRTVFAVGEKAFKAKDYETALKAYERAKSIWPHGPAVQGRIGKVQAILGLISGTLSKAQEALDARDYKRAAALAQEILDQKPQNGGALKLQKTANSALSRYRTVFAEGEAAFKAKDYETALKAYKRATSIWPHGPAVQDRIGEVQTILGLISGTLSKAQEALDARDYRRAAALAQEVLDQNPQNGGALKLLTTANSALSRIRRDLDSAQHQYSMKMMSRAEASYKSVLALDPKNTKALSGLKQVNEIVENTKRLFSSVETAIEKENFEQAVQLCSEILHLNTEATRAKKIRTQYGSYVPPLGTVLVSGGEFVMGLSDTEFAKLRQSFPQLENVDVRDEMPAHKVEVSSFFIGVREVTVGKFLAFLNAVPEAVKYVAMDENNIARASGRFSVKAGQKDFPVVGVSWHGAQAYCAWLTKTSEHHSFRLPTEAEWEFAARRHGAGKKAVLFPWGQSWKRSAANSGTRGVVAVGRTLDDKCPSGCMDMAGNVSEWCSDTYSARFYRSNANTVVKDPVGPKDGLTRVVRGGSWMNETSMSRLTARQRLNPRDRRSNVGFRLAAVPKPK